jgi:diguanylate cyclase (GGDEF)-like protein
MFRMDPTTLRTMLDDLEKADRSHAGWHNEVLRAAVCGAAGPGQDGPEGAHAVCRFEQWYEGAVPGVLRSQPAFVSLASGHRQVHAIGEHLLAEVSGCGRVAAGDYDRFVAAAATMKLEIDALQQEIRAALRSADALTGAYGRSELLPELRSWRELARRGVARCCIAFMDLDELKAINDTHGHTVGDQVLAAAVHVVTGQLRPHDKIFRYGGDEFLVLLTGADLYAAQRAIERVREALARTALVTSADGREIHTTASFGLAQLDPDIRIEESIDRADKALLLAKASGRNRSLSWDPAITTGTQLEWSPEDDGAG